MLQNVNDLIDSLRITKNGFYVTEEHFSIEKCMVDVLKTNYYFANQKGTKLKLKGLENMPTHLIGDKNRIT